MSFTIVAAPATRATRALLGLHAVINLMMPPVRLMF
jgi:hypothetical protein